MQLPVRQLARVAAVAVGPPVRPAVGAAGAAGVARGVRGLPLPAPHACLVRRVLHAACRRYRIMTLALLILSGRKVRNRGLMLHLEFLITKEVLSDTLTTLRESINIKSKLLLFFINWNCIMAGCSGSPRLQRRRRARERRKVRSSSEKDDAGDELAYIDSLPEVKMRYFKDNVPQRNR